VSRIRRRQYPKHSDDAFDRFITERSMGQDGKFSFAKMVELFRALDAEELIPADGSNGTKRMTAGLLLRSMFSDGVLNFKDGTRVILNLEEESK
jgi:hypothetical protein